MCSPKFSTPTDGASERTAGKFLAIHEIARSTTKSIPKNEDATRIGTTERTVKGGGAFGVRVRSPGPGVVALFGSAFPSMCCNSTPNTSTSQCTVMSTCFFFRPASAFLFL